jgi:teichuronic acid biosynthesis glycosyltransferase TuaG
MTGSDTRQPVRPAIRLDDMGASPPSAAARPAHGPARHTGDCADAHVCEVLVSVVTPAYNAERFLARLIPSVLGQTLRQIEWIVVDDCSTDGTHDRLLEAASDPRLRLIRQEKNSGVAAARNTGLRHARGRYVCFLDSDDYWAEDKLRLQYDFMERVACGISYMSYRRVDDTGRARANVLPPEQTDYEDMLVSNRIGNLTAMVRRELLAGIEFRRIGHEDYVFWLEAIRRSGTAQRVPDDGTVRCFYAVSASSLSGNKARAARWQWNIYRNELGLGLMRSVTLFVRYVAAALKKRV